MRAAFGLLHAHRQIATIRAGNRRDRKQLDAVVRWRQQIRNGPFSGPMKRCEICYRDKGLQSVLAVPITSIDTEDQDATFTIRES